MNKKEIWNNLTRKQQNKAKRAKKLDRRARVAAALTRERTK